MNNIFNSPLELGTRALFILNAIKPYEASIEKIAYLDYISIYSSEFNGPNNLHPDVPMHHLEFIFRIENLKSGLNQMIKKQIINANFTTQGIKYSLGEYSYPFMSFLDTDYHIKLGERSLWVRDNFYHLSDNELDKYFGINGKLWKLKNEY